MKIHFSSFWIPVLLLLLAFQPGEKAPAISQDPRLMSVAWFTFSAEKEACYLQTYRLAAMQLEREMESNKANPLQPIIITDLDETVLDNSAWSAKVLLEGKDYPDYWSDWEKAARAPAFPGAVEYFRKAQQMGIEVFYISNRQEKNLGAAILNLKNLGLPFADSAHIFLKTNTSNKVERRNAISKNKQILMLLGDNLADFDGVWEEKINPEERMKAVMDRKELWGKKFIIFPNPVYGTWKDALFGYRKVKFGQTADSVWQEALTRYLNRYMF